MDQKSKNSLFWPRNRIEAAAFVLSIVLVIGGLLVMAIGIFALRVKYGTFTGRAGAQDTFLAISIPSISLDAPATF